MNALINGEVDYWDNPPADLIPILREAEGVEVVLADLYGSPGLAPHQPPAPAVRQ